MPIELIAHYQLTRRLGAGGMGEVYLAQDNRLERQVALKLLPPEYAADPQRRQRFMTEAKAASALNHPNVCIVYEVGETEDHRPYIAMEYVAGLMLDGRLKQGNVSIKEVVSVGLQVADALEAAHARGVIHRDIKPSNISLNPRGVVKVLDFGLAKRMEAGLSDLSGAPTLLSTRTGQVMGTPSYMSPEQALGREVDGRSDLFSLGVVLYELATGKLPFEGTNLGELQEKIVHAEPVAVARLNYEVPEELERIIRKCLGKDADRRYQGARELVVDLSNLQRDLEAAAGGGSALARPGPREESVPGAGNRQLLPTAAEVSASDVFINCSEVDNRSMTQGRPGWVTEFQRHLTVKLEQLTGDELRICSYPMPVGQGAVDEYLLNAVSETKTMVNVVSPPFVKSNLCQASSLKFWEHAERSGKLLVESRPRFFKVVRTPVQRQQFTSTLAPIMARLLSYEFFESDPETGRIREFDESYGSEARQRYFERIYDLARELSSVLQAWKEGTDGPAMARTGKVIYLAASSSDRQADCDRMRRELEALGHEVLPDAPLPLIGHEIEHVVRQCLVRSDLAIHPIGHYYGVIPEGSDLSLIELQNRLSAEKAALNGSAFSRLIWLVPGLVPRDDHQKRFIKALRETPAYLHRTDLIEQNLEQLKDLALEKLAPPKRTPIVSSAEAGPRDGPPRVYLICDAKDQEAIEPLEDYFFEAGLEVSLPDFEADETESAEVHRQNLQDCDGVLIYYGAARHSWVDIKLRSLMKANGYGRTRPLEVQAVYLAAPIDHRKERFRTHVAEVIKAEAGIDPTLLASFVTRLKAEISGSS